MVGYPLALTISLLSVSVVLPYTIVDGPYPGTGTFPREGVPEDVSDPYSGRREVQEEESLTDMTIIKTHYDCRGSPMWREVSRVKSRAGEAAVVVKSSRETFDGKSGSASERPMIIPSRKSRLRVATATARTAAVVASTTPRPRPVGRLEALVEVGPDRVIDTPVISCPEGYNEDYNGNCRRVFP